MKNLTNFKANELNQNELSSVKGGQSMHFCILYIGQRTAEGKTVNQGQLSKAMELDAIVDTQGMDSALAAGGATFEAKYS